MSRAVELAKECWGRVSSSGLSGNPTVTTTFSAEQLEAFYHVARAEALREAADYAFSLTARCNFQTVEHYKLANTIQAELRAMADREGK